MNGCQVISINIKIDILGFEDAFLVLSIHPCPLQPCPTRDWDTLV